MICGFEHGRTSNEQYKTYVPKTSLHLHESLLVGRRPLAAPWSFNDCARDVPGQKIPSQTSQHQRGCELRRQRKQVDTKLSQQNSSPNQLFTPRQAPNSAKGRQAAHRTNSGILALTFTVLFAEYTDCDVKYSQGVKRH